MEVKATIYNSRGDKLIQTSLVDLFKKMKGESFQSELGIQRVEDYQNGIKINFRTYENYFDDRTLDMEWEKEEQAELYIFDNGEISYVHKGQRREDLEENSDFPLVYSKTDFQDVSIVTDALNEKLGKKIELKKIVFKKSELGQIMADIFVNPRIEESNVKKTKLYTERRMALLDKVKKAIIEGKYVEEVKKFDPETNSIVEQADRILA